ncbi:osmotic avoidance abnormal protein 3 isoform X2 [Bradysia coprophila]|uniref:osmotic avoidance abnormal protein 3 isoform X2 n=1 Tax=Bradysia coprophila TaxID=38358 RepID=UPI00187DA514|nr:osmotic avoidance abnormal protein 3 isoform X2 [Bradysia coprophila]
MAENVKVIVRCRPMNKKECDMKCKTIVQIEDCAVHLENPADKSSPPKTFTYDSSYDSNSSTEAIYNDICYSLVENVLEGYNGTIFAYGQTGCGKSHTMQGPEIALDNKDKRVLAQRGLISRSFDHIFEAISVSTGVQYLALVSYLEIYNENIRDLLNPNENSANLVLKEQPGEGVCVQNLSTHAVHNATDCERLLAIGTKNRIVGATLMNATSSRSHSIFTISLEQISTNVDNDRQMGGDAVSIKKGKLNLVDLAGSERQNKTGATGDRLKEATKINLSLSALGNVISALVDGKTKHVPYRDSKLTRLLQDSLGGNTKTLMIACISPAAYNYDETLSTLRYASRAKNIHNKPKINEDPKDAILREYQQEIMKLKQMLNGGYSVNEGNVSSEWLNEEKMKLKTMYDAETERLKREHEMQRKEKEDLVRDMEQLKLHYENQLTSLSQKVAEPNNNSEHFNNRNLVDSIHNHEKETINIKGDLIGGERANDVQLKEKHKRKKQAAEKRMSALANALNRIGQTEDRDILQGHYSSIQQELQVKTDALKSQRQKVRALEREVSDLQSEFQLDRADYLETIRRMDKNMKFYQQLIDKALPLLRRDGRFWDVDAIKADAVWNDDLGKWKLPENSMIKLKLPPAESTMPQPPTSAPAASTNSSTFHPIKKMQRQVSQSLIGEEKLQRSDGKDIAVSYFRPRRAVELIQQSRVINNWKGNANWATPVTNRALISQPFLPTPTSQRQSGQLPLSKTWCGPPTQSLLISANRDSLVHDQWIPNNDDSQLISENLSQQKHRPQAATAGRSRNLSMVLNDVEDDQSTVS